MKILQQPVKVKRGSRVVINFSQPSSIYLMTEVNFKRYKDGSSYKRLGGEYSQSPVEFTAPYDGTWHAVIEKGTSHHNPTNVTGSVEVLPPLRKETAYFDAEEEWKSDHPEASVAETAEEEKIEVLDEVKTEESEETESESSEDNLDEEEDEEKD